MNAVDRANLLAGHAVAHATAFLDGRQSAWQLGQNAENLQLELLAIDDPAANSILDPVRLLTAAMNRTARACLPESSLSIARQDRWQMVMGALVELVRQESRELIR